MKIHTALESGGCLFEALADLTRLQEILEVQKKWKGFRMYFEMVPATGYRTHLLGTGKYFLSGSQTLQ